MEGECGQRLEFGGKGVELVEVSHGLVLRLLACCVRALVVLAGVARLAGVAVWHVRSAIPDVDSAVSVLQGFAVARRLPVVEELREA